MRTAAVSLPAFLVVCLVVAFPSDGEAKCMSQTADAWPQPGSKLPANRPLIILEGSGNARSAIRSLGKQSLHLVADDDRVALRRIELLQNEKDFTQLVLKAEEDLDAGSTYRLDTNRLKYKDSEVRLAWTCDGGKRLRWRAGPPDSRAPNLRSLKKIGAERKTLGCAPTTFVMLRPSIPDDNVDELIFRVVVTRKVKSGLKQTYWVKPNDESELRVGHGMCGGEFDLEQGASYEVKLQAIDKAGNRSPVSDPLDVVGP